MSEPTMTHKCICCGKNDVTWPLVCDQCIDHEAQAELEAMYGLDCVEGPYGDMDCSTGMECVHCGMIYDGGQSCNYCGSRDPLDTGEDIDDDDESGWWDSREDEDEESNEWEPD